MRFDDIKGNESLIKSLSWMVDSGKVPHAIMLHENNGGGAFPLCMAFLQYLFYREDENPKISKLIHPDIHFVFPVISGKLSKDYLIPFREMAVNNPYFLESSLYDICGFQGKLVSISVAEANYILNELAFNSLEGGYKAVIIYLPEKMNTAAANKLLKSLEEPSAKTVFLLITHTPEKVLPTIASRCQTVRVYSPDGTRSFSSDEEMEYRNLLISLMDSLISKDLFAALEVGEKIAAIPSRDKARAFCTYAGSFLRKLFLVQQGMEGLAGIPESDAGMFSRYASVCRKTFPRSAVTLLGRAQYLIERNVNQKILFCDLVDRLFCEI